MCSQATRLLAVCFIVCIVYLTPTVSQCTTKYCSDDDNDVGALTEMVSRLQGTVEKAGAAAQGIPRHTGTTTITCN